MKRLLIILFIVHVGLLQSQLSIPYSSFPKIMDGKLNDWYLSDARSFRIKQKNSFESNSVWINTSWDDQFLYLSVRVYDHELRVVEDSDTSLIYRNDAVEFYIDPLNDSKDKMDINDYQFVFDVRGRSIILKGDKEKIKNPGYRVPKEIGTATIAFNYTVSITGTINNKFDQDSMFIVEAAIPWAAIGVSPKKGYKIKLDFCNNDADSSGVAFSSIKGYNDYGFPNHWLKAELAGEPGWFVRIIKRFNYQWLLMLIFLFVVLIGVMIFQFIRIRQLRQIPQRSDLHNDSFIHLLENKSEEVQHPRVTEKKEESRKNGSLTDALKDYVLKNINQKITAEDLANKSGYSLRHIQRIFKDELDTNPKTFILLIKIEEAARLIKESNKSISQIANEVGFSDPSYFTKVFKKYFNVSPTDYSKESSRN